MAKRHYQLTSIKPTANPAPTKADAFLHNFQSGLLLALLQRNLLTQYQYDRCLEELTAKNSARRQNKVQHP